MNHYYENSDWEQDMNDACKEALQESLPEWHPGHQQSSYAMERAEAVEAIINQ